ncbi:MHYT domain-containing protein [Hamadaea tsunoensis]|uniref:MHYT domain-containing protein n=1 Tax=Hamadaea tsunoensis TaxID=53368 RepID=UPI000420AE6F|nr:MHYT domain-containing protein [Hamadaea tsunoensis]
MAEIHQFAYGWLTPVLAVVLGFAGSLTGLTCTSRARTAASRGRRFRWLTLGTLAIGGAGVWLMHFMALLGFDVPASPLRIATGPTAASFLLALAAVGGGLFLVVNGRPRTSRIVLGGFFTGTGLIATHYIGVYAVHVAGQVSFDGPLVIASVMIAVAAATVALWCAVSVRGWRPLLITSFLMALAVAGMHYTAMAAVRVTLDRTVVPPGAGLTPAVLSVPTFAAAAVLILALAVSALQAMTQEEFRGGPLPPVVRVSARPPRPRTEERNLPSPR